MKTVTCANCFMDFGIPDALERARRNDHINFYCPTGHPNHYPEASEAEILRRERDRLKQSLAQKDDEVRDAKRLREQAEAKVARITKRIHNGVCTCCNRSFANLARHMKTKHPEQAKLKVA